VLAHLNAFFETSRSTDLDLGVGWITGRYEDETSRVDRNLYSAELAFTWRPPERARYRGVQLRAGAMLLDGLVEHVAEGEQPDPGLAGKRARGVWSMGEVRLSPSWLMGARLDWTENPEDPDESAWLFSPTLTWWQSEYVRIRGEYDLLGRSFESANEGRFILQVTFAMGPHKHATY
jgi:hypothetical protein